MCVRGREKDKGKRNRGRRKEITYNNGKEERCDKEKEARENGQRRE